MDVSFTSLNSTSSGGELESDIGRNALREICCSSLSRILDLSDNKLETLLGEDDEVVKHDATNNVAKNIANKFRALSHRLFDDNHDNNENTPGSYPTLHFGTPIDSDSQATLLQLMSHMETFASEEGMFRKSGSHSRIEQLTQDLGTLPLHQVLSNDIYGPADYASVLKAYFKSLPEPLMLRKHMEAYKQASVILSETKRTLCLQLLMLLLPPTHHIVLSNLLHLLSVISQSEESRMDSHNLALVFGPTLFFDTKQDDIVPELIPLVTSLLDHMISHNVEIFEIPSEVRLVAEKYMKRKESCKQDTDVPVDIYSSACKKSCTPSNFHEQGKDMAMAELASLYEYVKKMPEGPQKQHFLKKFESNSMMVGTPSPYIKTKKTKENRQSAVKVALSQGVGSNQTETPMRKKGSSHLTSKVTSSSVHAYATPLKPKANLMQYQRLETDV